VPLDEKGFFGSGTKRHQVLLKIACVDPSDAEWKHMLKVIERTNSPESIASFFAAHKTQEEATAAREAEKQKRDEPIKALAIEFLRRKKTGVRDLLGCSADRHSDAFPPEHLRRKDGAG